ncbi:MAG: cytochrome P450, partial [Rivularia sp. (in: cyanobacteria)]
IALNTLINRLPNLTLKEESIEWANNIVFHGPKHLQIGFSSPRDAKGLWGHDHV